jgi:hypothetical protein
MRRIRLVLAVALTMVALMLAVSPAMAQNRGTTGTGITGTEPTSLTTGTGTTGIEPADRSTETGTTGTATTGTGTLGGAPALHFAVGTLAGGDGPTGAIALGGAGGDSGRNLVAR